jgi:ankyrin repeat protein
MSAAEQHKPKVVHMLVMEFGASGNVSEHLWGMMSLLQYAARYKDLEMAQFLLDQGYDIHGLPINHTPLQLAAMNGDDVMVRLFINHDANVNKRGAPKGLDADGPSPLQAAIRGKNHSIARMLIGAGADPNKGSKGHYTSLTFAARNGDEEAVHLLLDASANPTNKDDYTGSTPLAWAAREKHINIFKILLDATTDLPSSGPAVLWDLSQYSHCIEAVGMLLERGVDPNSYRYDSRSILFTATNPGNEEIVRLLVKHGADPDAPGYWRGTTPRMKAEETFNTGLIDALNGDD